MVLKAVGRMVAAFNCCAPMKCAFAGILCMESSPSPPLLILRLSSSLSLVNTTEISEKKSLFDVVSSHLTGKNPLDIVNEQDRRRAVVA